MAITWFTRERNDDGEYETVVKETTHEGLVLEIQDSREVKVMSDVYATGFFATVWDPTTNKPETIRTGTDFDCDVRAADVMVDAPESLREAWDAYKAEQERLRREAEARAAEERRIARLKEPRKGRKVTVVRGRKVAKGTVGFVFWTDDYKTRVGIATSMRLDEKGNFADVAWVNAAYCEAEIGDINSEAAVEARLTGWKQARLDAASLAKDHNNAKAKQVIPCEVPF